MLFLQRGAVAIATLATVVVLSLTASITVRDWEQTRMQIELQHRANLVSVVLQQNISSNLKVLSAVKSFSAVSPQFNQNDLRWFAANQIQGHSETQALNRGTQFSNPEQMTFEATAQKNGDSDFQITQKNTQATIVRAARRDDDFPVYYIEPLQCNEALLGFDRRGRGALVQRSRGEKRNTLCHRVQAPKFIDGEEEKFVSLHVVRRNNEGPYYKPLDLSMGFPLEPLEPLEPLCLFPDLASSPVFKAALEQASATGTPVATSRIEDGRQVSSVSIPNRDLHLSATPYIYIIPNSTTQGVVFSNENRYSFLVFLPYQQGGAKKIPAERRQHLIGFFVGEMRLFNLVRGSFNKLNLGGIDVFVEAPTVPLGERLLHVHKKNYGKYVNGLLQDLDQAALQKELPATTRIDVAGHQWLLQFLPTTQFFDPQRTWQALQIMVAGLLFTTLLCLYLIRAADPTYSIEELVKNRTAELVEANAELGREVNERQRAEELLLLQSRCSALEADVGISLIQNQTLQNMLQECAIALVRHLDAALARIWTLNIEENVLELQASAGMHTHINGRHGRIPVGQFKIGLIAQDRQPHLTNQVIGDPRVHDQDWAARSGLVAFAGYPLMVEDRVVGVIAMFARLPLPEVTLKALASAANAISLGIKRQQAESALRQSEAQLRKQAMQLEQALNDLKLAQTQLIQTEKMSSLGQMVAGVAHEINNPVGFIYCNLDYANNYVQDLLGLVHLYQQHYPNPNQAIQNQIAAMELDFLTEDLPKVMDSMKIGAERIRAIVLSLRNFSRLDEAEIKPVNIHLGIDSTLLILNSQLKQGIEVVQHYGDLPLVECYAAQLNQVFMNILANAIDALQTQAEGRSKQIVIQTAMVDFNRIQVKIRDNGPGIPPQLINKLFDPFFTTKPVGKGTGLGLSISYQIIEKHRGQIEVTSQPTQETEFVITLPVKHLLSPSA